MFLLILFGLLFFLVLWLIYIFKKTKYGFFIVMGEFGAGKTQNTTAYMKYKDPKKEINISNYYTGYTDIQIMSHTDLIKVFTDIYDYHQYINLYDNRIKLYKFRGEKNLKEYEEKREKFIKQYGNLEKNIKFNLVLDEASIYFNPRNFKKNFSGENEKLLDIMYQPRKVNLLFFCVVQSPLELDVKFRRLATYFRKYYKGLKFYRWYKDYIFLNPEEMDLEKAEQVGGGILAGGNINLYPIFPRYDYDTRELIKPGDIIYNKGDLFKIIQNITKEKENANKRKKFNISFKTD